MAESGLSEDLATERANSLAATDVSGFWKVHDKVVRKTDDEKPTGSAFDRAMPASGPEGGYDEGDGTSKEDYIRLRSWQEVQNNPDQYRGKYVGLDGASEPQRVKSDYGRGG